MERNELEVNVKQISESTFAMFRKLERFAGPLRLGMLDESCITMLETDIRRRYDELFEARHGIAIDQADELIGSSEAREKRNRERFVKDTVKEIAIDYLRLAVEAGILRI